MFADALGDADLRKPVVFNRIQQWYDQQSGILSPEPLRFGDGKLDRIADFVAVCESVEVTNEGDLVGPELAI